MQLKLKIITLDGIYFEEEVDLVNLTTSSGNITILANHIPLISSIDISHMYIKKNNETINYCTKRFGDVSRKARRTSKSCLNGLLNI